jgi:ferredoxin
MPKVKFTNLNTELEMEQGANLRKAALSGKVEIYPGIHRYLNCRGFALCGKCAVAVKSGREHCSPAGFRERLRLLLSYLTIGREKDEIRLACQMHVLGDLQVEATPRLKM